MHELTGIDSLKFWSTILFVGKVIARILLLIALLGASVSAEGAESEVQRGLKRDDVRRIKILSAKENHIHLYVTDKQDKKYRLKDLSQEEANEFLLRMKNNYNVTIKSIPHVDGFEDIVQWK